MYSQKQKIRIAALLVCAIYVVMCAFIFTVGAELHWAGKIILMCGWAAILAFPVGYCAWEFKCETGVSAFPPFFDTGQRKHKTHKKDRHTSTTILESR